MEREISGYYFDGEKSWKIYKKKDGTTIMRRWK